MTVLRLNHWTILQEFHTRYSQSYKAGHSMWKTKLTSIGTTALASHLTTITVAISPALAKYLFARYIEPSCSVIYQLSNAPSNFCGIFSNTWRKYVFTCERIYVTDFFAHSHTHIHNLYVRPSHQNQQHIPAFSMFSWGADHFCLPPHPRPHHHRLDHLPRRDSLQVWKEAKHAINFGSKASLWKSLLELGED